MYNLITFSIPQLVLKKRKPNWIYADIITHLLKLDTLVY